MELLNQLIYGFGVCLQPSNLLYCFLGVLGGTLVGVLPGIGPTGAIALLIPVTLQIPPESAVIMLCGIVYGAMYGGSTTSILMNIPGEPASVVTCLDGYIMARQGRAGAALAISAIGSFIAGSLSIFGVIFLAVPLAGYAIKFGPPEYCALMIFAFTVLVVMASRSMIKGMIMIALGIAAGTIGLDPVGGVGRFTFRIPTLMDGVGLVQAVIGLFGISEILISLEGSLTRDIFETKIKGLFLTLQDWKDSIGPILRATPIGFFLGIIPGVGHTIPTFLSYGLEKNLAKDPTKYGKGFIGGVASPEAANNAAVTGHLIPMLSLGIPCGASMAIILGALLIYGVQPGPLLVKDAPQVFWGLVASLYIGNIMLLILNLPLIGIWVRILKVPYKYLSLLIILFCIVGSYSINYSQDDIIIMTLFGLVGYLAKKLSFEITPMVFGIVLGPMFEKALRRSLILSNGNFDIFFTRPISLVFICLSAMFLLSTLFLKKKPELIDEE